MSPRSNPKEVLNKYGGSRNADDLYEKQWVDTGIVGEREHLPSGEQGFNVSKLVRRVGRRMESAAEPKVIEEGDDYNKISLGNPAEGWAKYVEQEFGHRNAFAVLSLWNGDLESLVAEHSEGLKDATEKKAGNKNRAVARLGDAETVISKVATKLHEKMEEKQVDAGVVQDGTPILIDPDFLNTVQSKAPILNWVDVVAQAGFTASYNVVSGRDQMLYWDSEDNVRDLSGETGSAFTLTNEDKDMKIGYGLLDISDFASRAQSSLDFMDLGGTSMEIWMQGYGVEEAEMLFYGEPTVGVTTGGPKDEYAPEGLADLANDANTNYTIGKNSVDLSGDKALFKDIKSEILSLVKNSAANIGNLGVAVSYDMFDALENEANVNVRLREFDQGINFGRDPTGPTTLSIANVPVMPTPNIKAHGYGNGSFTGNIGDVFIFDRMNYQRRALQSLSSTPLGQLGLADRVAMFQYETPVSRSQGEFIRVLENYNIDSL